MGSALEVFEDFVLSTDSAILTGPEALVNEATRRTYMLSFLLKSNSQFMDKVIQGGKTIKDQIMFEESPTYQHYHPNETFTWVNPQVLDEWEIPWRFSMDHMAWTDHEITLNLSGQGRGERHKTYKRLKKNKERRMWTSMLNGMEDDLWAQPSVTTMETTSGKVPYSIPALVNEQTNGLYKNTVTGTWTTVQGISPTDAAVNGMWENQVEGFATLPTAATWDGWTAMDRMYHKVQWSNLPDGRDGGDAGSGLANVGIFCSLKAKTQYQVALRLSQDLFVQPGRQDPAYPSPQYAGVPLRYIAKLDTAALYPDVHNAGTTMHAEDSASAGRGGPRYYFLNGEYLCPVFHAERYFYKSPVLTHPNQPYTRVMPVDVWHNLVVRSRKRNGVVAPSADIAGY